VNATVQEAVISLAYRPQTSGVLMSGPRLQQSEQTTTLPVHACVTVRLGEFMLGNSRLKLPDINYVRTC